MSKKITAEKLKELYIIHNMRYSSRLKKAEAGYPNFRADELKIYINLWNEVKAKNFVYDDLTSRAKQEVDEAIFDEEE